jgi:hypothetical protein
MHSHFREENAQHIFIVSFLDYFGPVRCRRFAVNCSSHVRLHLPTHVTTISPDQVLIDVVSFAIWNRNKVVTVTAFSLWGIGIAFHIRS